MSTKLPTTIGAQLAELTDRLQASGIKSARLDGLILLEQITHQDRTKLLAHPETDLTLAQLRKLERLVARRIKREPLAYILRQVEFCGLSLEVNNNVLIPRPETETLVELVIKHAPEKCRLLEVGTGSGAIALALASVRPDLQIMATDLSPEALQVAKHNSRKYSISDIKFRKANLMHDIKEHFDVIVANLPYVPKERKLELELEYEPSMALFGGEDGLDIYRNLLEQTPAHLEPGGLVAIEAEPDQHTTLIEIAAKQRLALLKQDGFALLLTKSEL